MIKIGMMIGDRYEILEKIGTGGMSDVYKAKCHKLNRYVAVKVLKQEFSENANFVSKFRIEAQAAAGLMHPNIVNVYDVGEENGIYFIVMELVEGITLKKYIEKKARLSYKEAVSIAIQVCMGIEAAHNNHIIHRDIKPQNIIISKDGKVKVTDFGIAKAATSNTITSNVMGSVHYTSPEQARGGYSDEKSDIYSLGITLFEMLTGRVPFNGETTVAIAIKHIQEEMPSPKEYVPEVPNSVEGIVLKCCQKSPDRRYQNMRELISDLKRALMNPDEDFVVDNAPNVDGNTRMISDRDMARIKQQAGTRVSHDGGTGRMRYAAGEEKDYEEEDIEEDGDEYDYDPKMEGVITVLAVVAGLIICGIIIFLLLRVFDVFGSGNGENPSPIIKTEETSEEDNEKSESDKEPAEEVEMPLVIGWNVQDAQRMLEKRSLIVEIEYEESNEYAEGIVIEASHEAGNKIEKGTSITLTVSSGSAGIVVQETAGKTREDAETTLTNQGFQISWVENFSDSIPAGIVISQDPVSGTKVPEGSVITVNVSRGSQSDTVMVPNVIGMSEMDGTVELIEAGLTITTVSSVNHSQIPEGQICYQSYSQGSYVAPGTGIEIRISMGMGTYKYNGNIAAPSTAEAPDYAAGSEVKIVITTDNGQELYNTSVTSFPQPVNFYGVPSTGATVTFYYTVNTDQGAAQKSFTRRLEFVKE
ncbi:MAG: Stk1 family PASTA domain-containing Ser/Thr kinase [Lachnospiraceae bacterium]|nr:Stk1 family PASTA domain-containing Ser/Thr kinase [Lachnospiraceae bacterium]